MKEQKIMSFHYPEGLAAIIDESGAYHIRKGENEAYPQRFYKTFGFYAGVATAIDDRGYLHIDVNGKAIHQNRYKWSGNFQDGLCTVEDNSGFYHIDINGDSAYSLRFSYVGDFRYGIAVAYQGASAFHIYQNGDRLYNHSFEYAEPFHKGFAVVRGSSGYYHVNREGRAIHTLKLKRAEPFYNNYAFCEDQKGKLIRVMDNGQYTFVAAKKKSIELEEIREIVRKGNKVALLIRHSDRYEITKDTPNWGNDITLNAHGEKRALLLGKALSGIGGVQLLTSPVHRCIQTGEYILKGVNKLKSSHQTDKILGDPGVYFDHSNEHELEMMTDFYGFMDRFLDTGVANGMRPLSVASEDMSSFIEHQMDNSQVSVLVTHDLHAVCMMYFLGLKKADKDDWCDYLEGICFIQTEGQITVRHLAGLKDASIC
ncbi:MAG: histidine phosphatase family protein [Colwellia sp.]